MELDLQKILNVAQNYKDNNVLNYVRKEGIIISEEALSHLPELHALVTDDSGQFIVRSYEEVERFSCQTIMAFCVTYGIYCFPTKELIDFLRGIIHDSKVIEVGSGNGIISRELGIKGTDNFEQRGSRADLYEVMHQKPVTYGKHVEFYDAIDAVRRYKPDTVIASWLTHQYNPNERSRGGNMTGPKEEKILERVKTYIFVGNDKVHSSKPIYALPHETIKEPWLLSRTLDQSLNSIYIWRGGKTR
jgi:hypothetical protein